jgi:hypothetical protein
VNTRDFLLVGAGVVVVLLIKKTIDDRNALALANTAEALPTETNYVFSQKYKDCEAEVSKFMTMARFAKNTDLVAYKKKAIEDCMKKA